MRPSLIALVLFASPALADSPLEYGWRGQVVVDKSALQAKLDRTTELLSEAIGRADRSSEFGQMLRRARAELDGAREALAAAPSLKQVEREGRHGDHDKDWERERDREQEHDRDRDERQPPPLPEPPRVFPIDGQTFSALLHAIGAQAFSKDKLRVVEAGAASQFFLVQQVQQVLRGFSFSADRLAAARLLAPRILDRQNIFQLYGSFDFANDKAELKRILDHLP